MLFKAAVIQFVQLASFITDIGFVNSGARRAFVLQPVLPEDQLFRKSNQSVHSVVAKQLTLIEAT